MTRRTRTAALLSTATLLVGGAFSLGLAGPAAADDAPAAPAGVTPAADVAVLPPLALSPSSPVEGGPLQVTGQGCLGQISSTGGVLAASVDLTVNGPNGYTTQVSGITPNTDGSWASNNTQSITLGDAGDYTVDAACTVTAAGLSVNNPYPTASFTAASSTPPPTTPNPQVSANPTSVAPGGAVSIGGTGFDNANSVTISLAGSTTNAGVSGGAFNPVTVTIPASQAAGTLTGTVTSDNSLSATFTVTVTSDTSVDGPVPGGTTTTGTGTTTTGTSSTTTTTTTGGRTTGATTTRPTLPKTGIDSVWPGVVGGLLVLSGAGLLWVGRRREDAEVAEVAAA